jgi:Transposase IS66 family
MFIVGRLLSSISSPSGAAGSNVSGWAVEKKLREQKAGPQLRAAAREWQSRPVLTRLRRAMELFRRRTLPQGLLGQAIDYALKRWEALNRFVEDGRLEIDNNLIGLCTWFPLVAFAMLPYACLQMAPDALGALFPNKGRKFAAVFCEMPNRSATGQGE